MGVTHKPKAGAKLTGTEYEAADAHVVALAAGDIPDLSATYEAAGAVSAHAGDADPHPGYLTAAEGAAAYDAIGAASRSAGHRPRCGNDRAL